MKFIIIFLALQNLMCSEHSRDESSFNYRYEIGESKNVRNISSCNYTVMYLPGIMARK